MAVKVRQGRKASTLITGFETFFITPEFLGEELKRICATSTSGEFENTFLQQENHANAKKMWIVSPVPGRGNAVEVLVQGKQVKAVTELLLAQGVPKRWIETVDISERK